MQPSGSTERTPPGSGVDEHPSLPDGPQCRVGAPYRVAREILELGERFDPRVARAHEDEPEIALRLLSDTALCLDQHAAQDFPGRGLRNRGHELYLAHPLISRDATADKLHQIIR